MNWFKAVLIALDQLVNALCGGFPDEALSSVAFRWHRDGKRSWPMYVINALSFNRQHCQESYESERLGRQLPPEMRS